MSQELKAKVEKLLNQHGALDGGREVLLLPFGERGVRCVIVRPTKKGSVQERVATAQELRGSLNDQANGLVGRLLSLPIATESL